MSVKWTPKGVEQKLMTQLNRGMTRAVVFASGEVKRVISRGNVTGRDPSKPGEPPKVRTGNLRANVDFAVQRTATGVSGFVGVRKGVAGKYAFWLEVGTSKMAARPYLRSTVKANAAKIARLLAGQ